MIVVFSEQIKLIIPPSYFVRMLLNLPFELY